MANDFSGGVDVQEEESDLVGSEIIIGECDASYHDPSLDDCVCALRGETVILGERCGSEFVSYKISGSSKRVHAGEFKIIQKVTK